MKSQSLLLLFALCLLGVAGALVSVGAQEKGQPFDARMTLEETVKWVGRHLFTDRRDASSDRTRVWRVETRPVKAEGCTLSYWSTTETDGDDPVSLGYQRRELWTLNLRGLDAASIKVLAPGQVWFKASDTSRNAIGTFVYQKERVYSSYGNRRMGKFSVRDEAAAAEMVAALQHAVKLCQQGGR
jgi:hypothetical protein